MRNIGVRGTVRGVVSGVVRERERLTLRFYLGLKRRNYSSMLPGFLTGVYTGGVVCSFIRDVARGLDPGEQSGVEIDGEDMGVVSDAVCGGGCKN